MKIIGVTKKGFMSIYADSPKKSYSAYYMAYQVGENCHVIKIQAKQFYELRKNGIPLY